MRVDGAGDTSAKRLARLLADAHSIEQRALAQMREAAAIAGDDRLSAVFAEHLGETEKHERRVRRRLEAHGADPEASDEAGTRGLGMDFFAAHHPDTPDGLAAHAF